MDPRQGLGCRQCTSVIDIIRGGRRKIELAPWVKTLVRKEWQCTCCFGSLIICGELSYW
jgi:hypothetical protein